MTWCRLDDGMHDHPKFVACSLDAVGLWTLCLSYAGKQKSPAIPARLPFRYGATQSVIDELVGAGLWETTPMGWVIHDWQQYAEKPSTDRVREFRKRHETVSEPLQEREVTVSPGSPVPVPEPVPEPVTLSSESVRRAPNRFLGDPAVDAYRRTCGEMGVTVSPAAMAGIGASAMDCRIAGASEDDLVAAAVRCAERGGNPARMDIDLAAVQRQRNGGAVASQRRVEALLAEEAS